MDLLCNKIQKCDQPRISYGKIYQRPQFSLSPFKQLEDGVKIIRIEGCKYKVPDKEILAWLELCGEVLSEVQEDYFVIEEEEEFLCSDICQRAEYILE